jgi:hypothetical protein
MFAVGIYANGFYYALARERTPQVSVQQLPAMRVRLKLKQKRHHTVV